MRICLVNPKYSRKYNNNIPQGILSICSTIKNAGHRCDIWNCNLNAGKTDYSKLCEYDLVGFSVFTSQLPHAIEISNHIRGKTKIVWGGIHCLLDPQSILNKFQYDYVIRGEGEIPFLKLINYFNGTDLPLEEIEGLCYVKNGEVKLSAPHFMRNINEIADINYYDLPYLESYIERDNYYFSRKFKSIEIVTGRGCPWDCSFCINSIFRKHKAYYRSKEITKIIRELTPIINDFGIEEISLRDDDFFADKNLVKDWAEFAREKGLLWSANARYNYIREEILNSEKLRDLFNSGLYALGMSVEAGDEEIRNKIINKKLKDSEIYNAVDIIKRSDINLSINTSFVVYFPGDTIGNRIKNIKLMDYLSRNLNIYFTGPQVYRSYPGSKLYDMEQGRIQGDIDYYLRQLTKDGAYAFDSPYDEDSMFFFSEAIRFFFNTRIRQLQLNGKSVNTLGKRKIGFLISSFLHLLFFPIKLRLKYDYWNFLFEPRIIGKILKLATSFYRFMARIRNSI